MLLNYMGSIWIRGYYVFFKPFVDDRSDYNAKNVTVIEVPEKKRKRK